jgi:hypothetical protein
VSGEGADRRLPHAAPAIVPPSALLWRRVDATQQAILRLGRLRLRGPCGAQDEFNLAAIAQNLRRLATSADSGGVLVSATAIFSDATCFLMFEIAIALIVGFAYAVRERVFRQNQAERRQGRLSEEERGKA